MCLHLPPALLTRWWRSVLGPSQAPAGPCQPGAAAGQSGGGCVSPPAGRVRLQGKSDGPHAGTTGGNGETAMDHDQPAPWPPTPQTRQQGGSCLEENHPEQVAETQVSPQILDNTETRDPRPETRDPRPETYFSIRHLSRGFRFCQGVTQGATAQHLVTAQGSGRPWRTPSAWLDHGNRMMRCCLS